MTPLPVRAWQGRPTLGTGLIRPPFFVKSFEQRCHNATIDLAGTIEGQRFNDFNVARMRVGGSVCKTE